MLSLGLLASLLGAGLANADNITAIVNLGTGKGDPMHWASGIIYGIPDTLGQIPSHWYTDIGFRYGRAGGAQLEAPARGWIWGEEEYKGRLESTLSNYQTCREYDADFVLLPHDLWGTDHVNDSTVWPGDDGDWAGYDSFIKRLMADLKQNDALEGLVWDIWNEPDISIFWEREQQQWIDLYIRTHKLLRLVLLWATCSRGKNLTAPCPPGKMPNMIVYRSLGHHLPSDLYLIILGGQTGLLKLLATTLSRSSIPTTWKERRAIGTTILRILTVPLLRSWIPTAFLIAK